MSSKDDFLKKLLLTFKLEAEEHINAISFNLINLEKESNTENQAKIIETILRETHSLKGAARSVNIPEIESICQPLETVFVALKRQQIALSESLFNLSHQAVELLGKLASNIGTDRISNIKPTISALIRRLDSVLKTTIVTKQVLENTIVTETPQKIEKIEKPDKIEQIEITETSEKIESKEQVFTIEKSSTINTVRLSTSKLDSILLQAEEMVSIKLITEQQAIDLRELNLVVGQWKKQWAKIHPEIQRNQQLVETNIENNNPNQLKTTTLIDFLDWANTYIKSIESKLTKLAKSAETDRRSVGGMVDNLLSDMKKIVMLPVSSLLEIFPKIVRDLSRDQGKDIELVIYQGDIEIDRRILEEMKEPLIHLIRNSIDHGIESANERERKKKPQRAKITISITQTNSSQIEIAISDDGAGVDIAKVKQMVLKLNLSSEEELENLTATEILDFIFFSGISTSPIITDISGRGLGLAIVREKIEKLGGIISVKSNKDTGTAFYISLPITLTTFRGTIIRIEEYLFVVPTMNVERVARIDRKNIKTIENKETIQLNGQIISFARLGDILEIKRKRSLDSKFIFVLILKIAEKSIAFEVDEILNEQEVLVKNLGKQLKRVRNIAGATVLGTGRVVPIINVSDLIKSAIKFASPTVKAFSTTQSEATRKSILVAEDSITARTLVKNILESAGYYVKTAVDGVDALTILKTEDFNLVVSDIDMPRMSGLDLTARIRADKKLSNLPVILVTALEKREDRERGIDVGANAYIVKSSFDQSNLLEVVQRLI